jgi:endonuclease/exonuclease/phosphatase family metal-dependent hydrolase
VRRLLRVALSTLVAFQLIRVFLPIVFGLGERSGTTTGAIKAGLLALAASMAPLIMPVFVRLLGARISLIVVLWGMAGTRVVVQLQHPVSLSLAVLGMTISLLSVGFLLSDLVSTRGRAAGRSFVLGMMIGLALDTALRAVYLTWDYAWQPGIVPLLLAILSAAAVLLFAPLEGPAEVARRDEPARKTTRSMVLIGPFVFLQLLFLQSPAFIASSGRVPLAVATMVVLLGDAVAVIMVLRVEAFGRSTATKLAAGGVLVVLSFLLREVHGPALLVVEAACQSLAAGLMVMALLPGQGQPSMWSESTAFAAGSFVFVLFLVLYQIVYRIRFPLPNTVLAPAAALLLSLGGLGSRSPHGERSSNRLWTLAVLPLAFMLVPLVVALIRPAPEAGTSSGGNFVMVSYNVHLGIDHSGQVDPEALADVIEKLRPDVVALQEVPRGWAGAGGTDMAEWLSHRLRMRYVFAPAADDQFGNVLLTRFRVLSSRAVPLPHIRSAMRRSYVRATLDLGRQRSAIVFDAHLEGGQPDHRVQALALLRGWGGSSRTVIAGDMNMQPGDRDLKLFESRALVSVQDQAGQGSLATATNPKSPGDRVDWIFGTADLSFGVFRIGESSPSDHLPLSVQIDVR